MSRILSSVKDERMDEIRSSVENFLTEVSKTERELFSYQEVENMLLDLYNLVNK
jgi:hypothetical protein